MLPVVDAQLVTFERVGRATEAAAGLEQRHLRPLAGAVERRGDPGQATADHDDASACHRQRSPPATTRLRAATQVFSSGESEIRPRITCAGSSRIRSSMRR